jgi:methylmalonyl-CoA/ethylmalonyl-CoA epimerase
VDGGRELLEHPGHRPLGNLRLGVPQVYDRTNHGKKTWSREKIALHRVGGVELELVQPLNGDSIYRAFIAERGEGIHHLQFKNDKVDDVTAVLRIRGFPACRAGGSVIGGAYYDTDTKPLRAIWEPIREATDKAVGVVRYQA